MVVDFDYFSQEDGAVVTIKAATIDAGKTWITVDELIELMENCNDDTIWMTRLDANFHDIERVFLSRGWQEKHNEDRGKGWSPYRHLKQPLSYTTALWSQKRVCLEVKYINKLGKKIIIKDSSRWLKRARDGIYKITEEDMEFLNNIDPIRATPSATAIAKLGTINRSCANIDDSLYYDLMDGVEGGIIDLYVDKDTFVKHAYHYDITSLYPSVICGLKFLPDIGMATYTMKKEKADHTRYAYWIRNSSGNYYCNVTADIIPENSIKMPLMLRNPIIDNMEEMFHIKQKAIKGTPAYNEIKIELNGFIGMLIKRDNQGDCYHSWLSNKKTICCHAPSHAQLVEIYEYIIAKARNRILTELTKAFEQGAQVYQVNTDGFFTDKPISHDAEKTLGSLRFEYEAHNITFFACNQYACDEEICISGLPSKYYVPGQKDYTYKVINFDYKKQRYVFASKHIKLGEEVE